MKIKGFLILVLISLSSTLIFYQNCSRQSFQSENYDSASTNIATEIDIQMSIEETASQQKIYSSSKSCVALEKEIECTNPFDLSRFRWAMQENLIQLSTTEWSEYTSYTSSNMRIVCGISESKKTFCWKITDGVIAKLEVNLENIQQIEVFSNIKKQQVICHLDISALFKCRFIDHNDFFKSISDVKIFYSPSSFLLNDGTYYYGDSPIPVDTKNSIGSFYSETYYGLLGINNSLRCNIRSDYSTLCGDSNNLKKYFSGIRKFESASYTVCVLRSDNRPACFSGYNANKQITWTVLNVQAQDIQVEAGSVYIKTIGGGILYVNIIPGPKIIKVVQLY